jgi:DNA-binding response OmpR family regulator
MPNESRLFQTNLAQGQENRAVPEFSSRAANFGFPPMERILIIEDELPMCTALRDALSAENYRVLTARDGETGLQRALAEKPDLILLDIMMPKLDGYALCSELRRLEVSVPILMLTAKGQVEDRVAGLDVGADDYLVKPFSTQELLARVRALLRRVRRQGQAPGKLRFGEVEIDLARQTAIRGRNPMRLTAKEFAMLRLMSEAPGEPVSRERFLDLVWGYTAFPTTRTVDTHIASLRGKIEINPEEPRWIKTVHGVGYKLELEGN